MPTKMDQRETSLVKLAGGEVCQEKTKIGKGPGGMVRSASGTKVLPFHNIGGGGHGKKKGCSAVGVDGPVADQKGR